MTQLLRTSARYLFELAKRRLKTSPWLRSLVYDQTNRQVFTGLEWHEKMLADAVRTRAYRKGIASVVKRGDVVVDLGTGTGILAMFAAASGARQVYAIDHSDFIRVAEEIGRSNGFGNIRFVQKNSRDFECPEPADVIVHEQMGHTIFGENMVYNLLDLKRRALKPGGKIAPARFELFAGPVRLKDEYRIPHLWEIGDAGIDLSFLEPHPLIAPYRNSGHGRRLLAGFEVACWLAPPQPVITLDMNEIESESDIPVHHTVTWRVDTDGMLDGICFYFKAEFEDGTSFDTSPLSRKTSWDNLLLRTPHTPLFAGSAFTRTLDLDPLTEWGSWRVREPSSTAVPAPEARPG